MYEHVNVCGNCGKNLYCVDGFFEGVYTDDKRVLCIACEKNEGNQKNEDLSI